LSFTTSAIGGIVRYSIAACCARPATLDCMPSGAGAPGRTNIILRIIFALTENITMAIPKLTGNQFRAARSLAGLTRDQLADRSGLSRDVLRSWEVSSDTIIPAQYQFLCKAVDALEQAGIAFTVDGVARIRPPTITAHSQGVQP